MLACVYQKLKAFRFPVLSKIAACLGVLFFSSLAIGADFTFDDSARLLAGLTTPSPTPAVEEIQNSKEWQSRANSHSANALWTNASSNRRLNDKERLKLAQFAATHMSHAYQNTTTVLYAFGGADVIYPFIFFPNMQKLILIGLENPGTLPDLNDKRIRANLPSYMSRIAHAYDRGLLSMGYYITEYMGQDLQEFGVVTNLCVGLSLMGNVIENVETFKNGVRVTYKKPEDANASRVVEFHRANLSNSNFSQEFENYLRSQNITTSYFKAPSYLPQQSSFSRLVDVALSESNYIIQSEAGIRLEKFGKELGWQVNLFGYYKDPAYKVFSENYRGFIYQPELRHAYAQGLLDLPDSETKQKSIKHFEQIWGTRIENEAGAHWANAKNYDSYWRGELPFVYDYNGALVYVRESNLIYAIRPQRALRIPSE